MGKLINLFGLNLLASALSSSQKIISVNLSNDISDEKLRKHLKDHNILPKLASLEVNCISQHVLKTLAAGQPSKGCITRIDFAYSRLRTLFEKDGAYIQVYHSDNLGNVGAVIRSAEIFGFNGVILPTKIQISETIIRTSAGAALNINIYTSSVYNSIKLAKQRGFTVIAIERGGINHEVFDYPKNSLFVIGGEDKDLFSHVLSKCDHVLSIRQFGVTNSLNMSVAASIIMNSYCLKHKNVLQGG